MSKRGDKLRATVDAAQAAVTDIAATKPGSVAVSNCANAMLLVACIAEVGSEIVDALQRIEEAILAQKVE